jgi:hypothetical protein
MHNPASAGTRLSGVGDLQPTGKLNLQTQTGQLRDGGTGYDAVHLQAAPLRLGILLFAPLHVSAHSDRSFGSIVIWLSDPSSRTSNARRPTSTRRTTAPPRLHPCRPLRVVMLAPIVGALLVHTSTWYHSFLSRKSSWQPRCCRDPTHASMRPRPSAAETRAATSRSPAQSIPETLSSGRARVPPGEELPAAEELTGKHVSRRSRQGIAKRSAVRRHDLP